MLSPEDFERLTQVYTEYMKQNDWGDILEYTFEMENGSDFRVAIMKAHIAGRLDELNQRDVLRENIDAMTLII